jgi:UDP-N-acetylglucosamine transferase subunit ALG13
MIYGPVSGKTGRPKILVAPLDWGLGHATRCIPVIYELLRQNAEVWLAGEGAQEALLKREFPGLTFLYLRGYRMKYGNSRSGLLRDVFMQVPGMLSAIKNEHAWLQKAVAEHHFDAVISDNRFGLYHPAISCVFITHQLHIKTPFGGWSERVLQKCNYRFINRFNECWVPDEEGENNLAGELSHPSKMPGVPVHYIGALSRMKKNPPCEQKRRLFITLSGPEPQRTIFENIITKDIVHYQGRATIVRGLPAEANLIPSTNDIHFFNHLPSAEMNNEMEKAEFVIARSGYSTVMDIAALDKKSILVATPGQPEQEYLAKYLSEKGFAVFINQEEFSLNKALQQAAHFDYRAVDLPINSRLNSVVQSFLSKLQRR